MAVQPLLQQTASAMNELFTLEESVKGFAGQLGFEQDKRMQACRTLMSGVSQLVSAHRELASAHREAQASLLRAQGELPCQHPQEGTRASFGTASSDTNDDVAHLLPHLAWARDGRAVDGLQWQQSVQIAAMDTGAGSPCAPTASTKAPMPQLAAVPTSYPQSFADCVGILAPPAMQWEATSVQTKTYDDPSALLMHSTARSETMPTASTPSFVDPPTILTRGAVQSEPLFPDYARTFADPSVNFAKPMCATRVAQTSPHHGFVGAHPMGQAVQHETGGRAPWWEVVEAHAAAALASTTNAAAASETAVVEAGATQPMAVDVPLPAKLRADHLAAWATSSGEVQGFLPVLPPPGLENVRGRDQTSARGAAVSLFENKRLGMSRPLHELAPGTTTLLVRNIPSRYAHVHLLKEWTDHKSFDFLYRPYSLALKRNLGHALINFVSPEAAVDFQRKWHGKRLSDHGQTRALDIIEADMQGSAALLAHFGPKMETMRNPAILPVVLRDGVLLDAKAEAAKAMAMQP